MWQPVGNECVINIAVLFIRLRLREEVNLYLSCPSVDTSAVFAFSQLATAFGRYNATVPSSDYCMWRDCSQRGRTNADTKTLQDVRYCVRTDCISAL